MAGKGSGWHGESRRHSLARKGVKTVAQGSRMRKVSQGRIIDAYGIKFDAYGEPMVAEGILGDLYDKAKSSITQSKIGQKLKEVGSKVKAKAKEVGVKAKKVGKKIKEKFKPKDKPTTTTTLSKPDSELKKRVDKVNKAVKESQEEELEQASHFGKKPSKEEVDIDNKGRVGALKEKIASEEKKVPREQLTDMPEEVFESPDADSIIAIAENSEKLIDYSNELKHDINMIKVERKRLAKRFESDEVKELRDLKADRQKARSDFERKKDQIKMAGMDEAKIRHKITKLESEYKQEYQQREIEIGALRGRNRVTLKFLDDLTDDLTRNVRKIDKKVKQMTAYGKVK